MSSVDWSTVSRGWTCLLARVSLLVFVDLNMSSTCWVNRNSTVAASALVAERSVKIKRLKTHRFHKAQVYCANCYSDPVW